MQCSVTGLHIIDVTNPAAPFQVQFIRMTGRNPWRDSNVHTDSNGVTYAYVAAQGGFNPSLFIIRLSALAGRTAPGPNSNPIPPTDIVNRGYVGLGHTMNVENGLLFLNSARPSNGCRILDLEADPFNPPQLSSWAGSGKDCHDSYQRNGVMVNRRRRNLLFTADGYSRRFRISDITDIRSGGSPQEIGSTAHVSGIYAHSLVVSEDKKTMYTFEEHNVYDIGIYDISNPAITVPQINTFTWSGDVSVGSSSRVHNGHIRGKYLLVAYYEAGLRIFDVSNPLNPMEVGKYETWRDPDGDGNYQNGINGKYEGAWNLHPYLPSGNVLVSDDQSGLFIVQVNPVPLPAVPSNVVATGSSSSSVTLTWNAVSGATGYTIQRGTSSGVYDTTLATNVVGTSYTDSSVSGGALYYAVSATNAEGDSGPSASIPAPRVRCGNASMVLTQPLDIEIRENADRGGNRGRIVVDRRTTLGEARALIKFPEINTNIPNGATITSAQLRFFTKNPTSTAGTILGYSMSAVWDNNSNWAAVNGGVDLTTKNLRSSFSFTPSTDEENVFVNVSPTEVQAWLDGSTSNEGWVMVSDSNSKSIWKQPLFILLVFLSRFTLSHNHRQLDFPISERNCQGASLSHCDLQRMLITVPFSIRSLGVELRTHCACASVAHTPARMREVLHMPCYKKIVKLVTHSTKNTVHCNCQRTHSSLCFATPHQSISPSNNSIKWPVHVHMMGSDRIA